MLKLAGVEAMKKTIITVIITISIMLAGFIGAKVLLFPGDKTPAPADITNIPITSTQQPQQGQPSDPAQIQTQPVEQIPAVTPALPGSDEPVKFLDIGIASFNYDSTKLVFDEIPSDQEDGVLMVSFMPADASEALPRVDAMPVKVSAVGEGDENFYNMTEESWKNLAAACVLQYLSPSGREQAQISFSGTVVKKEEGPVMKMFTNISITVPENIAAQTGDVNMNGSVRLISANENAIITMAMYKQNSALPQALTDAYMSLQVRP